MCAVQCNSDTLISSSTDVNKAEDDVQNRLAQLIADANVHNDAIHAFITVIRYVECSS